MHDECLVARDAVVALGAARRLIVRRLSRGEVRCIQTCPFLVLFIPPDQLFALAPRLAVGARGSTVIKEAAVRRPGKAPPVTVTSLRLALPSFVFPFSRHDAG